MEQLRWEVRHAARSLRRAPLFSSVIVLTLALGIGVGATLFTFVDAVLFRPLPVERPKEMIHLFSSWEGEPWAASSLPAREEVDHLLRPARKSTRLNSSHLVSSYAA